MGGVLAVGHKVDAAEAAGVVKGDDVVVGLDNQMVVTFGRVCVCFGCDGNRAGHTEMDDEGVFIQVNEEVFAFAG